MRQLHCDLLLEIDAHYSQVLKQLITQTTDIVLDFGAGTGASTEFILEYTYQYRPLVEDEDDLCKIWSIDFWDKDFVIRCYDYFGLKETADAYRVSFFFFFPLDSLYFKQVPF